MFKANNRSFDEVIDFCCRRAPQAPIGECVDLATRFANAEDTAFLMQEALALLSRVLCLGPNWEIPAALIAEFRNRPAFLWALHRVQYCQAWIECGPVVNAMEKMEEQITENIKNKVPGWEDPFPKSWLEADRGNGNATHPA